MSFKEIILDTAVIVAIFTLIGCVIQFLIAPYLEECRKRREDQSK